MADTPTELAPSYKKESFLKKLGPGLITGASDDDPSGIATYSQAGAQFGYGLGWTLILSYPLMSAIQEASARLGRITGRGLATNLRKHCPRPLALTLCALLVLANVINAAADLGAIAAAVQLLIGGPSAVYVVIFGVLSALLMIYVTYDRYARFLKWLCLSLFAYVATVFVIDLNWADVAKGILLPAPQISHAYIMSVVAVFGTTISPYLFFWQASQEAERQEQDPDAAPLVRAPEQSDDELRRIRLDTYLGMAFSNIVGLFILITTAATLHAGGHTDIKTSAEAAEALRPVAGDFAFGLFAAGLIGTGMLAIPVLIGSAAFATCGVAGKSCGLSRKPGEAPYFYGIIAGAFLIAMLLNLIDMDPVKALIWSAVINGIVAVPIMATVMLLARNPKVVKTFKLSPWLTFLGWCATLFMGAIALALIWSFLFQT
jgi:NRAMP (natural resistance-associated macrophage protein)-like metal ion transporter